MKRKHRLLWVGEFSQLATGFSTYASYVLPRLWKKNILEDMAEQAIYLNNAHPLIDNVPWKVYPNEPDVGPNREAEMQIYTSDPINQFGKWKFNDICLDFRPTITCFPPEELVFTDKGYIPISDVKLGDQVLTHKGRYRKVTKLMRQQYEGDLIHIYTLGHNNTMKLTPEHPVLVFRKRNQTWKKKKISEIYTDIDPEWIEAKNIKTGDLLITNPPKYNKSIIIDITKYLKNYKEIDNKIYPTINSKDGCPRFIELDEKFARLIGYLIGDGCWSSGKNITIFLGLHETKLIKDVQNIFKEIFHINIKTQKSSKSKMILCSHNSVILSEFLINFLGVKGKEKHIPQEVFLSSNSIKENCISGLVRSDGNYSKNTVSFLTFSERLAYEYRMLCYSVGLMPTVKIMCQNTDSGKKYYYRVDNHGINALKLHQFCQKRDILIQKEVPDNAKRSYFNHKVNDYIVTPVRRVRKHNYTGQVYNLSVEEDETYTMQYIVHNCSIADPWMNNWIFNSPYRDKFKTIFMPTVDGSPQRPEWIEEYAKSDLLLTYSYFGKYLLEKESFGKIQVFDVASPGSDIEIFKPMNKSQCRKSFGMKDDIFIIGSIMRNQGRKLFPEIMKVFNIYLDICRKNGKEDLANKSYLYFHTSSPDVGWNLSEEIRRHKLSNKILFTYICNNPRCGACYSSFYHGDHPHCRSCMNPSAKFPDTAQGITREALAKLTNCFDAYIQYSISEGWGMPISDAKACGIPVFCVKHSAMAEQGNSPGGFSLEVSKMVQEPLQQTNQLRAAPNNEYAAQMLYEFAISSNEEKQRISNEARKFVEENYNWDLIADIWERAILSIPVPENDLWMTPPKIIQPNLNIPPNLNNEQFLEYAYTHILHEPRELFTSNGQKAIECLNNGYEIINHGDGRVSRNPVNRDIILQWMINRVQEKNHFEKLRYTKTMPSINKELGIREI